MSRLAGGNWPYDSRKITVCPLCWQRIGRACATMEDMSASSETILEGLDDAQMSAVTALDGPVRIIAGAGAGKTRTVTRRIAYACARGDWDARKVLAVTFSVKAAAEMRARLQTLGVGDDVTAATFHSAALNILKP